MPPVSAAGTGPGTGGLGGPDVPGRFPRAAGGPQAHVGDQVKGRVGGENGIVGAQPDDQGPARRLRLRQDALQELRLPAHRAEGDAAPAGLRRVAARHQRQRLVEALQAGVVGLRNVAREGEDQRGKTAHGEDVQHVFEPQDQGPLRRMVGPWQKPLQVLQLERGEDARLRRHGLHRAVGRAIGRLNRIYVVRARARGGIEIDGQGKPAGTVFLRDELRVGHVVAHHAGIAKAVAGRLPRETAAVAWIPGVDRKQQLQPPVGQQRALPGDRGASLRLHGGAGANLGPGHRPLDHDQVGADGRRVEDVHVGVRRQHRGHRRKPQRLWPGGAAAGDGCGRLAGDQRIQIAGRARLGRRRRGRIVHRGGIAVRIGDGIDRGRGVAPAARQQKRQEEWDQREERSARARNVKPMCTIVRPPRLRQGACPRPGAAEEQRPFRRRKLAAPGSARYNARYEGGGPGTSCSRAHNPRSLSWPSR